MRAQQIAWFIAACALLSGCSTVERGSAAASDTASPVTIESTARLDRLLLLAPVATCTGGDNPFQGNPAAVVVDADGIANFLRDWKDYDVVLVPEDPATDALVTDLASWHEKLEKNEPVPPSLKARLEELSQAQVGPIAPTVTGVLVVHSHIRFITATDMTLYFMFVGMPNLFRKLFERNTSIALYDPRRGELLWSSFFQATTDYGIPLQDQVLQQMENLPAATRPAGPRE